MQIIYGKFMQRVHYCINLVLPPLCVVSGQVVERQGMVAPDAWQHLDFVGAPLCETCGVPFGYEVEAGTVCAPCLEYSPRYDSARAALVYNDGSRGMILGFKHSDKTYSVRAFTPWLMRAGADMMAQADVVVPVPLHSFRLIMRRYNQAALLAQAVAREAGKPCLVSALSRVRATKSQGHMDLKARRKNVRAAFQVRERDMAQVKGARVVLVDDVLTTGATVNECAKMLKDAGAVRVDVLVLARVVRDGAL